MKIPVIILCILAGSISPAASSLAEERPPLLFREDWRETPAATPVTQEHVANPALALELHGPGRDQIKKSHHDTPKDDPYYVWSGQCRGNWAVALRPKELFDLTGQAKVRWRAKQAGFRVLRLILRLADGKWLVADQGDGPSEDWREKEFVIRDLRWRFLNIDSVTEGSWVAAPELARVEAIGFTDLMSGGASAACSRLDWIEVWARPAANSK
jgi:hypothetical protein